MVPLFQIFGPSLVPLLSKTGPFFGPSEGLFEGGTRLVITASDTNFRKNEKYVWGDSSRVPKKPCMAKFEQTPKFEPMKQKIVVYFIGQTDRHFEYPQLKLRIL